MVEVLGQNKTKVGLKAEKGTAEQGTVRTRQNKTKVGLKAASQLRG